MIEIRRATGDDNAALLALVRMAPMAGAIELRTERDPDFFGLLRLRGEDGAVFVAASEGSVVGSISAAFRDVYVAGRRHRLAYIGDLRVDPAFAGSRVVFALIRAIIRHVHAAGVDIGFCVVAAGNARMLSLMDGRRAMPLCHSVGDFLVSNILPSSAAARGGRYEVQEAGPGDLPAVCRLCNDAHARYQLGPVTSIPQLVCAGQRILIARRGDQVVATASSFDPHGWKRHVVLRMPLALVLALRGLRRVNPRYGWPRVGEPVRTLYLRNLACRPGDEAALVELVRQVRHEAFERRSACVGIGLHRRDPLRHVIRRFPRYSVRVHGFVVSVSGDPAILERIAAGVTMDDFAVV